MPGSEHRELGFLAKLVLGCLIALALAGIVWHGVTAATVERVWHQLIERTDAPMRFRFILQPLMAALVAIRDGRRDAQSGRSPYFWKALGVERLGEALNATARVVLLGLVMDLIYQAVVLQRFYPTEAVIVALLFAFIPYLIIRGPVARLARRRHGSAPPPQRTP